jgi:DNA-binding winged helix-turn-helix (wHTH) protein/tetratricopeptide (TPR) repeat protein
VIEFSPFRLDPTDQRLWRGDSPIHLRPKSFQVLRYLVQRPGRLVTTSQLLDTVWPEVAVSAETLTQVIAELRRALGDDARQPAFIQTVHRRGIRFIAGVQPSPSGDGIPARPVLGPRAEHESRGLVGREAELARLGELLLEARAGRRQIVFVTGEPGIGKTSLVRTFLEDLMDAEAGEPVWIAVGRCVELHGEGEAYLPVLEAFDRLAREAGAQPVVRCLSRFAPSWLLQMPWLPGPDEAKGIQNAAFGATPTRMLREFCVAVEALSEERTLVLWLEDLHWSDASTVDLLAALAARSDPARLLVLATYRPVDAAAGSHPIAPLKRSLLEQHRCEELWLEPLDEAAVRACLSQRLGGETDAALAALFHEQTEGNPLFIVTLHEYLVAEGLLEHTTEGWKPSAPLEALRAAAPESLRALVEAQLARLDDEEVNALQAGSAIGETFGAQAVAAGIGREVEFVEKVCGRIAGWRRFLEAAGPGRWPDGSTGERFRFLHAVFRHVIYRGLPAGRRQKLHHRIAERLEVGYSDQASAIAAELALHFERGGDPDRAVDHLVHAAAGVRQRAGDREAVGYFSRALELLGTLPESVDRNRRELELRMYLWREVNASAIVSAADQDASLDRALELCDRLGDSRSRGYVSSYRSRSLIIECELDVAESLDDQSVMRASTLGDPVLLAAAHSEIGDIAFYRGDFDRAQREHTLCLSALEGVDPPETCRLLGHDPGTLALGYLGWTHWLKGRPDEAHGDAAACLARAEACGYPLNRAFSLAQALLVEQFRRDTDAANALATPFAELAEEHGFALPYPTVYAVTGWMLAQGGEVDAASVRLREGVAVSHRVRTRQGLSHLLATLAETELGRGRAKEGLATTDEALAFVEETGERFWEAEILRIRGELLRLDRQAPTAEACFQTALDVARGQGALSLELRAAASLARLWKDTGRGQEARPQLAAVYGRFSEGFDTPDLRDAQALLDSL